MCASLGSQICLTVRVIRGRFILIYSYTYRVLFTAETCNQVSKMGVETMSY